MIKDVNQKLPEFTSCDPFSVPFYRKILSFITPFIKECSKNTAPISEEESQKGEGTARVEALTSLCKYYRLVEINMSVFQNFSHFKANSFIVIIKNYRESKLEQKDLEILKQEVERLT